MQRKNERLIKAIALKFKRLREEKGETQHTVYLETDLNIGNLEVGRTNFTISTISILCDYYGISLKDFFDGLEF